MQRYIKNVNVFTQNTCYSCQVLIKLESNSTDFRKFFKYVILLKSVQRQPGCSMRTDRQADTQAD